MLELNRIHCFIKFKRKYKTKPEVIVEEKEGNFRWDEIILNERKNNFVFKQNENGPSFQEHIARRVRAVAKR